VDRDDLDAAAFPTGHLAGLPHPGRRPLEVARVEVVEDDGPARGDLLCDRRRVPTVPGGAVGVDLSRCGGEEVEDLGEEDGNVKRRVLHTIAAPKQ